MGVCNIQQASVVWGQVYGTCDVLKPSAGCRSELYVQSSKIYNRCRAFYSNEGDNGCPVREPCTGNLDSCVCSSDRHLNGSSRVLWLTNGGVL